MPFLFCNIGDVCHYASRTSTSYWLSAGVDIPMMPTEDREIFGQISRCAVCQAPAPILTMHSQTSIPPNCPSGWSALWEGYSFLMVNNLAYYHEITNDIFRILCSAMHELYHLHHDVTISKLKMYTYFIPKICDSEILIDVGI